MEHAQKKPLQCRAIIFPTLRDRTIRIFFFRRGFYKIRQHFAILLRDRYGDRAPDLLRGEFPSLALGISGASLHPLEELGAAAAAGAPASLVVDALAYLHHSFCPNFITIPRWGVEKGDDKRIFRVFLEKEK